MENGYRLTMECQAAPDRAKVWINKTRLPNMLLIFFKLHNSNLNVSSFV